MPTPTQNDGKFKGKVSTVWSEKPPKNNGGIPHRVSVGKKSAPPNYLVYIYQDYG